MIITRRRRRKRSELQPLEPFISVTNSNATTNRTSSNKSVRNETRNHKLTREFLDGRVGIAVVQVTSDASTKMTAQDSCHCWRHPTRHVKRHARPSMTSSTRTFIATDHHHHHQPAARMSPLSSLSTLVASNKLILTTTMSLIVIALASLTTSVICQEQFMADTGISQLDSQSQQSIGSLQPSALFQQKQYISVEPNKPARIECKLPQLVVDQSNRTQNFYWNFQRISDHIRKPEVLCWGTNCLASKRRGIELDFDQASGTYDLLIRNATYKENDGIYYCEYRDTSSEASHTTEIQLTILIPPQPPTITAVSQSSPKEGQEYQLECHSYGGNPEPNITWFKGDQVILPGAGVRLEQTRLNGTTTSTLTWIPTIDDHNATYKCSVSNRAMSSPASYERELTLQVEFAPRISVGPYNPLKVIQGDRATLSCQVDAYPPVKSIKWYKDGNIISNQYNHTVLEVKISDSGIYSCHADNGIAPVVVLSGGSSSPLIATAGQSNSASGSSLLAYLGIGGSGPSMSAGHDLASKTIVEARLYLEVQYAPRVQIRESRSQPLSEGDHFVLNCSVDSSPPAYEFVWTKQEDAQTTRRLSASSSPTLEFQTITASDMGNYTCTAYNRLEPSGQQQQVYERHSSVSMMVFVRHKPGLAEIFVGQNGETELGNVTQIQCRARPPGYPEAKYSFWKLETKSGVEKKVSFKTSDPLVPQTTIYSARTEDEGRYVCLASNELGQSNEAVGDLIVNEAPSIVPGKTWHDSDSRQPGTTPYSITVQASGRPEPKVTWFHRSPVDGRRIDLSSPEMQSKFRIDTQSKAEHLTRHQQQLALVNGNVPSAVRHRYIVVSTLTFKQPLQVDDRGLYSVEFSNGLSRSAILTHQLHINHAPVPALKNMPVIMPSQKQNQQDNRAQPTPLTKTKAGYNIGETVNLTCRVSAYPQPQFVWYSQSSSGREVDKILDNSSRYRTSSWNPQDDIWEGTLSFQLASESDYGDYMCVTANTDTQTQTVSDSINIFIQLGRKSAPEPPSQVEQIDATQDSVTLQWLPGFDGGFPMNQFIVQYAADDGSGLSLSRRYGPLVDMGGQSSLMMVDQSASMNQALADSQQPQYPKLYDCLSMNPCTINNLQPRQAYLMRLRARNELAFSDFSEEIRVTTRANVSQIPRIQEAYFDLSKNILHYRVEPNPEYLLNSLEIRIDVKSSGINYNSIDKSNGYTTDQQQQSASSNQELTSQVSQEWRRHLPVPLRHEQGEVYLNMMPDVEMLRLTLCSRLNDTLCGQEFLVSTQSASSSFLQDQRGLSMSIFVIVLFLLAVITVMATTLHSKCLSRKAKKAAALDSTDHTTSGGGHHHLHANGHHALTGGDNKPSLAGHINGGLNLANGTIKVGSHGSTTSTNSTSATTGGQLQSLDSINQNGNQHLIGNGSASDHSSDHSRQAKLDSMLPPNYSHYADRASLMLEQQQQQQQQQHHGYLQDKLGSPFGLPTSALLGHNQMGTGADPNGQMIGDYFGGYGQSAGGTAAMSSLDHQQMLEATGGQHPMMMSSVLGYDPNDGQSMYTTQQALVDDYNYNNALAYTSHQDHMIESAYGTTTRAGSVQDQQSNSASLMMAQPTQANFDNSANQTYLSYPNTGNSAYDQHQRQHSETGSSQYQHDLAAAQQQMYGTLTRTSTNSANNNNNNNSGSQQANSSPNNMQDTAQQQYLGAAGLMPPPPLPPPPPPQESDYGTTGARNGGRLIREIIV